MINHTGVTQAQTLAENEQGEIWLMGDMDSGETRVAGTLDASAPDRGDGGFIETSAAKVSIADEAVVTTKADNGETGEWLIDPTDIEIVTGTGGDFAADPVTSSSIGADTLVSNLATNNITVQTPSSGTGADGDITVSANVVWNADTTLTLDAINNIYVNAMIENTNATDGGVDFDARNTTDAVVFGTNGKVVIHNVHQLQWMNTALNGIFELGADIDASGTANWNGDGDGNFAGWDPVGDSDYEFRGIFDGQGHTIIDLTIDRPSEDFIGLFGYTGSGEIRGIGLMGGSVTGHKAVGGVVGFHHGVITDAYATGNVSGSQDVGGLVGLSRGVITNAYTTGVVTGSSMNVGGLVGDYGSGTITDAFSAAQVEGSRYVGGLVGSNATGEITNVYASGDVTGSGNFVGGLVGINNGQESDITNAYATGDVAGDQFVGGLVGYNADVATVTSTYATGTVTGNNDVGGFAGKVDYAQFTENNYYTTTDADSNIITNDHTNSIGKGITRIELMSPEVVNSLNTSTSAWSSSIDTTVAGYQVSLPYLDSITRQQDIEFATLFEGGAGTTNDPFILTNWQQLQNVNHNTDVLTGGHHYILENDLKTTTLGYTALASATAYNSDGWKPIGGYTDHFQGWFDGHEHVIHNLTINRETANNYVGLFGYVENGTIQNLGLESVSVTGGGQTGGLAGRLTGGSMVKRSYVTGEVAGATTGSDADVGGMLGASIDSTLEQVFADVTVTGKGASFGGLVGHFGTGSDLTDAYAFAVIDVQDSTNVGGLLGEAYGTVRKTYATGEVINGSVGGLIGKDSSSSTVNSFWDTGAFGVDGTNDQDSGATGLTSTEMLEMSRYTDAGWSISDEGGENSVWRIYSGQTTPLLRSYLTPVTVDSDISKVYDGDVNGNANDQYSVSVSGVTLDGTLKYTANSADVGAYRAGDNNLTFSGLYSDQQGYDISYNNNASLEISRRELMLGGSFSVEDRAYDGTASATLNDTANLTLANLVDDEDLALKDLEALFSDPNVGDDITVTLIEGFLADGNDGRANNYTLTLDGPLTTTATITPRELTLDGTFAAEDRIYDGTTDATLSDTGNLTLNNLASNEDLGIRDLAAAFAGANAGDDITVNLTNAALADGTAGQTSNYTLVLQGAPTTTSSIKPRNLTLTADDQQKDFGDDDPLLTWQITGGDLVGNESLTGNPIREPGESAGRYAVQQGSIDDIHNPNYAIDFVEGELTIIAPPEPAQRRTPQPRITAVINQTRQSASSTRQDELPAPVVIPNSPNPEILLGGIQIMAGGINTTLSGGTGGDN
ncbi:MAG: GLUG motif-containing protein [Pseudomonadota bacterium]